MAKLTKRPKLYVQAQQGNSIDVYTAGPDSVDLYVRMVTRYVKAVLTLGEAKGLATEILKACENSDSTAADQAEAIARKFSDNPL